MCTDNTAEQEFDPTVGLIFEKTELTPCDRYGQLPLPDRHAVCDAIRSMQLDSLTETQRAVAQAMIDAYGICNAKYCAALWRNC